MEDGKVRLNYCVGTIRTSRVLDRSAGYLELGTEPEMQNWTRLSASVTERLEAVGTDICVRKLPMHYSNRP